MRIRRIISSWLVVSLLVTWFIGATPLLVLADEAVATSGIMGSLNWDLSETGVLTISGSGSMRENWPESGAPWKESKNITGIVISNGITDIADRAFVNCSNITSITLPNSISEIPEHAFFGCHNLTNIVIPEGVTKIGSYAFHGCRSLTTINIPNSVTEIAEHAFSECISLQYIDIPDSVTTFGIGAFSSCTNLTTFSIPNSITTIPALLLAYCENLKEVSLHYNVKELGHSAFYCCYALEQITIPGSVKTIGMEVFGNCTELNTIKFLGNSPQLSPWPGSELIEEKSVFSGVTATAYYPANNDTWTDEYKHKYGDNIIWVSNSAGPNETYQPNGSDKEPAVESPCRLNELWDVDYLAFSAIAYLDFENENTSKNVGFEDTDTVKGWLVQSGYWDSLWSEDQNITYAELCDHIAHWKVTKEYNLNEANGFYALAFKNENNEAVIAYRGSEPPSQILNSKTSWIKWLLTGKVDDWDAYCDWILNDLPIVLGNSIGPQFGHALGIYNDMIREGCTPDQIIVTGHSLGGGWADAVSAYSGSRGITFNAISIMDALYKHDPEKMSQIFSGVDNWNFVDHANQNDILAGMYEKCFSTEMKPYISHETNIEIDVDTLEVIVDVVKDMIVDAIKDTIKDALGGDVEGNPLVAIAKSAAGSVAKSVGEDIASSHTLQSYVVKHDDGTVSLTKPSSMFFPGISISNYMLSKNHSVDFGSSRADEITNCWTLSVPRTSYGGDGDDKIVSSILSDTIIGGKGRDTLDGSWGNDEYVYYLGDGYDVIQDVSGNDTLTLYGINEKADINIVENLEHNLVDIYCDNELIVSIVNKNRSGTTGDDFSVEWNGVTSSISGYLNYVEYSSRIVVGCPVNIQILDENENVVYTIYDGEPGTFYTDYGNFYIYEENDGSFGKTLDLIEGYTVKIIGVDTGSMDIAVQQVDDGALSEVVQETDIPVSDTFEALIDMQNNGSVNLITNDDAHIHIWGNGIITKEPTCTIGGEETFQCAGCSESKVENVEKLGHDYSWKHDAVIHWQKCNTCGEETNTADHAGGVATCTEKMVCSVCGVSYGELAAHDYKNGWSHGDANGHWHECSNCDARDTQIRHIPGPAATETTAQFCTECGYVITPAISHTCTVGSQWYFETDYHWRKCTFCGSTMNSGAHSYSAEQNTICNICGYVRNIKIPDTLTETVAEISDENKSETAIAIQPGTTESTEIPELPEQSFEDVSVVNTIIKVLAGIVITTTIGIVVILLIRIRIRKNRK